MAMNKQKRKLYILNIWGIGHLALLDDYQANFIAKNLGKNSSEYLFRCLDGTTIGVGLITRIIDVEKDLTLEATYNLLKSSFPNKTKYLFMENDYSIINNTPSKLSFQRITTNEQLIQFVLGNRLTINTETVSVKVKVQAECDGAIEIPDYYSEREIAAYIKSNMNDLKITNISCDLSKPIMNSCDIHINV